MYHILFIVRTPEIKAMVERAIVKHRQYYQWLDGEYEEYEYTIDISDWVYADKHKIHYTDIIVARNFAAYKAKKDFPSSVIVEIPITINDLIESVSELKKEFQTSDPVAYIGFGNITYQTKVASKICNIQVDPFHHLHDRPAVQSVAALMERIQSIGYTNVLGDIRSVEAAREKGLNAAFIGSSEESIWMALTEAVHIARIRRTERERSAYFETILNCSHEGIIATDKQNDISFLNPAAKEILNLPHATSQPLSMNAVFPNTPAVLLAETLKDEVLNAGKSEIVLNKEPIFLGEEQIGSVITFQNVANVQTTEIKIRSKLYHRGLQAKYGFGSILGQSAAIRSTIDTAKTFSGVSSNIVIIGETGTGKELFAQSIHSTSKRKHAPFVAVNCAAIPESLMESEFFGYAGGAFTGAAKEGKAGYFEMAHEGTLFLDEISELPLNMQGRLLRVLQEHEIMRIGHDKIIPVNVRVICATNRDLQSLVEQGTFREDLYYRLFVLRLLLPPLRHRGEDIPLLAGHFIRQYCSRFQKRIAPLAPGAEHVLQSLSLRGNVRELRNICEQLVVLNKSGEITPQDISAIAGISPPPPNPSNEEKEAAPTLVTAASHKEEAEKTAIREALSACGFHKQKTAGMLGMSPSTLWRKMKKYGIEVNQTL